MIKALKILFFAGAIITWTGLFAWLVMGEKFVHQVKEVQSEIVGTAATRYIAKNATPENQNSSVKTVAGLHHIEIELDQIQEHIYRVSGVANSYLIKTSQGSVLFDTGLATQAAKQKRLLKQVIEGDIKYIILSHSHADHLGGTQFWLNEYPDAKIITHRKFLNGQQYLRDLETHFWNRNRLLYTFMPEHPPSADSLFAYGKIKPDLLLDETQDYSFTLGDINFIVKATPGAEGEDNIVLWLPQSGALLSGDFFGPLFPMLPNLFTLRGEKFRDPLAYLESLQKLISLGAKLVLPSHFDPIEGQSKIREDMQLMYDATDYLHSQTIAGMNKGKSVWQLMQEIKLPEQLSISQGHGKLSWNVRSIWEHYSTWFKFESTTELYPVPIRSLYPELAQLSGGYAKLLPLAKQKLELNEFEKALHLIEISLAELESGAQNPTGKNQALRLRLQALNGLLDRAWKTGSNFSETGWLESRIRATEDQLKQF